MEFFHQPNFDWMGRKWVFITCSLILAAIGLASIAWHRGLAYGIDFRGGTLVYVKFSEQPNVDAIRRQLDQANLRNAIVQQYEAASKHEFIIGLDLETTTAASALDTGREDIVAVLSTLYGAATAGKVDFNNASPTTVTDHLVAADPLGLASRGSDVAAKTYQDMGAAIVNLRNDPTHGGLIGNFQELSAVPGVTAAVLHSFSNDFYLSGYHIFDTQVVGPKVGADLRLKALEVTLAGLGAMLLYIWFRFELIYGVAAVIATFHDVIITLGIFSLLNKEITLTVIAALLTLVGYSMNDTVVVFDRIRENVHLSKRENFKDLVNRSVNQTLSRTILTSGLTFVAVLALYLLGGEVLRGFSLVLVIGVVVGTYSSFAIASPIVLFWRERAGQRRTPEKAPKLKAMEREAAASRR